MTPAGCVLLIARDGPVRRTLERALERAGYVVVARPDARGAPSLLRGIQFDAILVHGDPAVARAIARIAPRVALVAVRSPIAPADGIVRLLAARLHRARGLN